MTNTWPYFITAFSLLVLGFITWHLVFNKAFRNDILAADGELNVKSYFTVKGSAFLVIYSVLTLAAFSPLIFDRISFQQALDKNNITNTSVQNFIQQ